MMCYCSRMRLFRASEENDIITPTMTNNESQTTIRGFSGSNVFCWLFAQICHRRNIDSIESPVAFLTSTGITPKKTSPTPCNGLRYICLCRNLRLRQGVFFQLYPTKRSILAVFMRFPVEGWYGNSSGWMLFVVQHVVVKFLYLAQPINLIARTSRKRP